MNQVNTKGGGGVLSRMKAGGKKVKATVSLVEEMGVAVVGGGPRQISLFPTFPRVYIYSI